MAITGSLHVYPGTYLSEQDFALLMDRLSYPASGIIAGCDVSVSGNVITVADGWISIRGRVIKVTSGTIEASYSASGATNYLLAKLAVYTGDSSAGKVSFYLSSSISHDTSNFNTAGGSAYLNMATVVSGASSITVTKGPMIDVTSMLSTVNTALNDKVDKVSGKGLSTNDFTDALKTKLENIDGTGGEEITAVMYGRTSTNATVYSKIVIADTYSDRFNPREGEILFITFENGNNVTSDNGGLNLTVGNYGYHFVWYDGARITRTMANSINAGDVCIFKYDSTVTDVVAGVYQYICKLEDIVNALQGKITVNSVYDAEISQGGTIVGSDRCISFNRQSGTTTAIDAYTLGGKITSENANLQLKQSRPYTANVVDSLVASAGFNAFNTTIASGSTSVTLTVRPTISYPKFYAKAYTSEWDAVNERNIYTEVDVKMTVAFYGGGTLTNADVTRNMTITCTLPSVQSTTTIVILYGTITTGTM